MANRVSKRPFEMACESSTSSGYSSDEEVAQYFTARTSFFPKTKKAVDTVKQDEKTKRGKKELTTADIQQKVKEYNAQINSNLFMKMKKDRSYKGFIKVQFKLSRPVLVAQPKKDGGRKCGGVKCHTSFYVPKDASKHLHTPNDITIRTGHTVSLECAAVGHPTSQISWQEDNGTDFPAARERRIHVMLDDNVFLNMSVKPEDNTAGTVSANATLTVLGCIDTSHTRCLREAAVM